MSYPDTTNGPTRVALPPDWREGVTLVQAFDTSIQRSRSGLEQRQRRRNAPNYFMEYSRTGLTPAQAKQRLDAVRAEFRGPLTVPIWTDGIQLQSSMTLPTGALLESNPVEGEWTAPLDLWFWDAEVGGQWRSATVISGRNLTLSGAGTLFPVGSYVFPSRTMIRENAEGMLSPVDVKSGTEMHRYRTI